MTSLFRTRRFLLLAAMTLILPLAVACSGGDDDDDPTATTESSSAVSTSADTTDAVSTEETDATATSEPDSTPDTGMDATAESDATPADDEESATPDADSTPEADMAGTPETDSTPDTTTSETPDSAPGSGDMVDDPFAELGDLQTDVPNFTLDFTGSFENVPDDTGETFSADLEMMLMQSEMDIYHLSFMTTGDDAIEIEVWSLADSTVISESGEAPVELPAGFANEFAPADVLVIVPPVETLAAAEEVGPDEVDGRDATHYRVDPEAAALLLAAEGSEIEDPQGDMDIWLDDELGIVVQMTADVTWTNADDTEAAVVIDYAVSDIDETDEVEAPAS